MLGRYIFSNLISENMRLFLIGPTLFILEFVGVEGYLTMLGFFYFLRHDLTLAIDFLG